MTFIVSFTDQLTKHTVYLTAGGFWTFNAEKAIPFGHEPTAKTAGIALQIKYPDFTDMVITPQGEQNVA